LHSPTHCFAPTPPAAFWNNEATRKLTENTPALSAFNGASFDCVFFVGGFGVMWDFPQSADVARVASEACVSHLPAHGFGSRDLVTRYAAGKIIGGVCHGPIFLANVKAPDGSYVVRVAPASRWLITAFPL